ncbi:hypothetical protein FGO68_gene2356 [Halteria grandinella]|uniref:histidine kinase n=1 Tax=Halteria grandinella TaxID=5974 RepID=A0A8J8NYI5_HALGN|nr:hypothetical protein FGO68_gene2356 [Halteria grandinella]
MYAGTCIAVQQGVRWRVKAGSKFFEENASSIILSCAIWAMNEANILTHPDKFEVSPLQDNPFNNYFRILGFVGMQEYFNMIFGTPAKKKNLFKKLHWLFYLLRNLQVYGSIPGELAGMMIALVSMQGLCGKIYEDYIQRIKNYTHEMTHMFANTLNIIPNGVLIINIKLKTISFVNKEMEEIVGVSDVALQGEGRVKAIQERVCLFFMHDQQSGGISQASSTTNEDLTSQGASSFRYYTGGRLPTQESQDRELFKSNLWDYIIGRLEVHTNDKTEIVFKQKNPKRYIQVKSQLINEGSQIMAICTDITRLKEMESQGRRMRSSFFSSVAHELRTPLNSVIPILKMTQTQLQKELDPSKIRKFIQIALNSSQHLENVIEDALDISRLENNKFQIFKEMFEVRDLVKQVSDIMRFQVEQKGLLLKVQISEKVPWRIHSDQKRLKQVLFNLLGNAIKFTFSGSITLKISFDEGFGQLQFVIKDTGVGIQPNDLNKLFKFFGTLAKTKDINRGGMGLGLTISKMIIQQLGGSVNVESVPNQGTEFSFWIPLEVNEYAFEETQIIPTVSPIIRSSKNLKLPPTLRRSSSFQKLSFTQQKRWVPNNYSPRDINRARLASTDYIYQTESSEIGNESPTLQRIEEGKVRRHSQLERNDQIKMQSISEMYLKLQAQSCQIVQNPLLTKPKDSSFLLIRETSREKSKSSDVSVSHEESPKLRILCVDDSSYNLFVIQELLKQIEGDQIEIETALNGNLALQIIKQQQHVFDIILMDLHMPILDGYQTAKEVRDLYRAKQKNGGKEAKIVALSAITKNQFEQNLYSQYFDIFSKSQLHNSFIVEKPINIEVLGLYIQEVREMNADF